MRPVVMTAAMAALGLLPAALSHAVGAETSRPFAVVIVGGLVTATALTLFIVPLLYPHFERERDDCEQIQHKGVGKPPSTPSENSDAINGHTGRSSECRT